MLLGLHTFDMNPDLTWQDTLVELGYQVQHMNEIHEKYPGKENTQKREELLKPHRKICIELHYIRIKLLQEKHGSVYQT